MVFTSRYFQLVNMLFTYQSLQEDNYLNYKIKLTSVKQPLKPITVVFRGIIASMFPHYLPL